MVKIMSEDNVGREPQEPKDNAVWFCERNNGEWKLLYHQSKGEILWSMWGISHPTSYLQQYVWDEP